MIFILLRHGHKSMDPADNPCLTDRGYLQAKKLLQYVQENKLPLPSLCLYSEKIRTKETLDELISHYRPRHEALSELNLRSHLESAQDFRQRIQKLIHQYTLKASQTSTGSKQVIYACTHYDWIDEALTIIDADVDLNSYEYRSWAPAQYIEFQIENGLWYLKSKGIANI